MLLDKEPRLIVLMISSVSIWQKLLGWLSYVEQHSFFTTPLKKYLLVSSPGGELRSHIVSPRVSIAIRGATFSAALRVLDTKGIDVILGMDTLAKWGVRIDYAQRTVHLSEEGRGVDEDLS